MITDQVDMRTVEAMYLLKISPVSVSETVKRRMQKSIGPFVDSIPNLVQQLRISGAIISGSRALEIATRHEWKDGSVPGDLDIVVPEPFAHFLIGYFISLGYTRDTDPSTDSRYQFSPRTPPHVWSLVKLTRGTHHVDLSLLTHLWPENFILLYHATPVMNFISADHLVVFFPDLTFARKGFANPVRGLSGATAAFKSYNAGVNKYRRRGYWIRRIPTLEQFLDSSGERDLVVDDVTGKFVLKWSV